VWQIIEKNIDPLRLAIKAILPPLDELEKKSRGMMNQTEVDNGTLV